MPNNRQATGTVRAPVRNAALAGSGVAAVLALVAGTVATTPPPVSGMPTSPAVVTFGVPVLRLLVDALGVAAVGLAVLPLLLGTVRPVQSVPLRRIAYRAAVVVGATWVLGVLLRLWFSAAELAGQGLGVGSTAVLGYVLHTTDGTALLVTGCGALAFAGLGAAGLRLGDRMPAGLPLVAAPLGLLPVPLTGHAADGPYADLTMLAVSLHTVGAAAWLGGLGVVFTLAAARRAVLAEVLPRFSALAGYCLVTVAVSGLVLAGFRLGDVPGRTVLGELVGTGYGRLVLAKLGCLLSVAMLGGYTRFRLLPGVLRHRRTATAGWVGAELVLLSVALGCAAALARAGAG